MRALPLLLTLTLTGCGNVAVMKPIEAEGVKDTLKAHMVCCRCGWDTLMPFYTDAFNDYKTKRNEKKKVSR